MTTTRNKALKKGCRKISEKLFEKLYNREPGESVDEVSKHKHAVAAASTFFPLPSVAPPGAAQEQQQQQQQQMRQLLQQPSTSFVQYLRTSGVSIAHMPGSCRPIIYVPVGTQREFIFHSSSSNARPQLQAQQGLCTDRLGGEADSATSSGGDTRSAAEVDGNGKNVFWTPLLMAAGGVLLAAAGFVLGMQYARKMLQLQQQSNSLDSFYETDCDSTPGKVRGADSNGALEGVAAAGPRSALLGDEDDDDESECRTPHLSDSGSPGSVMCFTPPPNSRPSRLSPIFKGWTNADNELVEIVRP